MYVLLYSGGTVRCSLVSEAAPPLRKGKRRPLPFPKRGKFPPRSSAIKFLLSAFGNNEFLVLIGDRQTDRRGGVAVKAVVVVRGSLDRHFGNVLAL